MTEIQRRRNLVRTFIAANEGKTFTKKDVWEWVSQHIDCTIESVRNDIDIVGAARVRMDGGMTYALTGTYLNTSDNVGTLHGAVDPDIIANEIHRLMGWNARQAWRDGRDAIVYCDLHSAPKLRLYVLSIYLPQFCYPLTCPHEPTWLRLRFNTEEAAEDFLTSYCQAVRVDIL
jgi:hypothetical protein